MLLSDKQIIERAQKGMISPFEPTQVKKKPNLLERGTPFRGPDLVPAISWGTSSFGYDIRLAREFKIFTNLNNAIVDPKGVKESCFVERVADEITIPANSFALARSYETIDVPRDILVMCIGKSTYARCGIIVNVTPLEPEWRGEITIEISNTTSLPAKIYAEEGIAQLLFFQGAEPCQTSYADRKGKYQDQKGITLPRA